MRPLEGLPGKAKDKIDENTADSLDKAKAGLGAAPLIAVVARSAFADNTGREMLAVRLSVDDPSLP
jgi:hypothetical protein